MSKSPIPIFFLLGAFLFAPITVMAADHPVPKHVELGRELLSNLAPEDNSYRYKGWIKWKGDLLASRYEAHIDCSGFTNQLLTRAHSPAIDQLQKLSRVPQAKDYHELILRQDGFVRIEKISEVRPGDIIAVRYPPGNKDTGHVMLVDAPAALRNPSTKSLVHETTQWAVTVLDSSKSPHGKEDTRRKSDGTKVTGVGRGVVRLYANEHEQIVGYSWSTSSASRFYSNAERSILIGRAVEASLDSQ